MLHVTMRCFTVLARLSKAISSTEARAWSSFSHNLNITMQIESNQNKDKPNRFYVVVIDDFYGPQEPKIKLVQASSVQEAILKTRMGNPDLIKAFADEKEAAQFVHDCSGKQSSEV